MNKKSALGKGLGALIPNDVTTKENNKPSVISINLIKSNNDQPRKSFDDEKIAELSQSINEHGIIQPIILNKQDNYYMIIAGERRWRAAKLLGLK
ncbi:ParB/RepB/Spo0J family partition protein, partial [Clostridium perfringens]